MKQLLKNKSFMLGFLFIFFMLTGSLVFDWFFENNVPVATLRDTTGDVKSPPYSPWEYPPFGTNNFGESFFHVLLIGAKYTVGIALIIAFLRFAIATVIGTVAELYVPKLTGKIRPLLEGFYYYPVTLIAFLMLEWILFQDAMFDGTNSEFTYSFGVRVLIEMGVLIFVAVPITSSMISSEVKLIRQKEFMESVHILGGSRFHILKKHIAPFIKPQLFAIFLREVIQVLVLLAHLGILGIFFGGGAMKQDLFQNSVFVSLSNEWSGLIGNNFRYLFTSYWWMAFIPIVLLTLTILAFKLMLEGYQEAQEPKKVMREKVESEGKVHHKNPFERVYKQS